MFDLRHALNCQNVLSMREIHLFRVVVYDAVTKATATTLCKSLEKFQIKTTSNKIQKTHRLRHTEPNRKEMKCIELNTICSNKSGHSNGKNGQTNISILVDELFWYLVCIESRSCYNFNCLLFVARFRNESIRVYALIFTWTFLFVVFVLWFWGFVMCCLL